MNKKSRSPIGAQVEAVLRFERFYGRRLHDQLAAEGVGRELNLLQRQILDELLLRPCPSSFLRWRLDVDAGHLWRTLEYLQAWELVTIVPAKDDARQRIASLTRRG